MTLRSPVVATAGHVDHGKSTLVRALTGIDPDRLAEEKRRGLTIELGFVTVELGELGRASLVDVPGHERFISTMLAGVAVIDAVLLCVDVGEGWRAQTEEHLRIVELAGVSAGVIALTKASTVSADRIAQRAAEVAERVAGTVLAGAPAVACDGVTGQGLDRLRSELGRVLAPLPPPVDRGRPRLWVDRSFTIGGAGTVVTGGVTHGSFSRGEGVDVVTATAIRPARIRGIQSLGEPVELARSGSRAALNLPQVSQPSVRRGDAIVRVGDWHLVEDFDASFTALADLGRPLTARGAYLGYVGTAEMAVRFRPLGGRSIQPGATGPVRIRLPRRLPLAAGDRFVLRDAGRRAVVGGGVVTDVQPVSPATHAVGWVDAAAADRAALPTTGTRVGRWTVDGPALEAATAALTDRLEAARPIGLDLQTLDPHDRDLCRWMESQGAVVVEGGYAIAPAWSAELEEHPYLAALRRSPFRPPAPGGESVGGDDLRALARRGHAVQRHGVWFAAEALVAATDLLRSSLEEPFSVSSARQVLGTSRRCVVPLLELLDAAGTTSRGDEGRRFCDR